MFVDGCLVDVIVDINVLSNNMKKPSPVMRKDWGWGGKHLQKPLASKKSNKNWRGQQRVACQLIVKQFYPCTPVA